MSRVIYSNPRAQFNEDNFISFGESDSSEIKQKLQEEKELIKPIANILFAENEFIKDLSKSYDVYDENSTCWIQTYTGKRFDPINPISSELSPISIFDIAHSLSMQTRFTGHTKEFYSIAQHSVLVSWFCDKNHALAGLLHDATEAYLTDIASPLKNSGYFDKYKEIENNLIKIIYARFKVPHEFEPLDVKVADKYVLHLEASQLINARKDWNVQESPPLKIECLQPKQARDLFLRRFFSLINKTSMQYEEWFERYSEYDE